MKNGILIIGGFLVGILLLVGGLPEIASSPVIPTRTYREGMTYGGQNCIMFHDKLYWEQSIKEGDLPDTMKLVGTVTKAVDALPVHNFESAVTEEGSELYYTDNNPGCLIVKEKDIFFIYGLQDNSIQ